VFAGHKLFEEIAAAVSRAVGAGISGDDMMIKDNEPYVLEVNMNPGFAISDVTNKNIFASIADYVFEETQKFIESKT